MPQAIQLVAALATAGPVAAGTITAVQGALIVAAASVAAGALSASMAKKPPPVGDTSDAGWRQQVIRVSDEPHHIVVGEIVKSGPMLFYDYTEDDKYFHMVIGLAGHECEEISDIYINDELLTGSKYEPYVRVNRHLGSPDQLADADLVLESNLWTDSHRLRSITNVYLRFEWPATDGYDIWSTGVPNVKVKMKGAKYLDPRTGLTAWTENAAVIVRGFLAADYGMKCTDSEIDDLLMIADANICDEVIDPGPLADLVTVYDWQFKSSDQNFVAVNSTIYPQPEYITVAASADPSGITAPALQSFNGADNRFVRIRIRQTVIGTGWRGYIYYATAGHGYNFLYRGTIPNPPADGEFHYYEIDMHNLTAGGDDWATNDITGLRFYFATDADPATSVVDVEWVQVGNREDQKRYTCNGTYTLDMNPADIVEGLVSSCVGSLCYSQGKYRLQVGAYTGSEDTGLTASDLRDDIEVLPRPPRASLFNAVRGLFVSPDDNWQSTDFPAVTNQMYVDQDGGEELWADLNLPYTTDPIAAQRIAKIHLERARQGMVIQFPAKWSGMRYRPEDIVPITIEQLGLDSKPFRIVDYAETADGAGVDLVMQEFAPEIYDWNHGEATKYDPAPDTNLPDPGYCAPPTNIDVQSGDAQLSIGGDGTVNPAMLVTWTSPVASFVIGYQVEWQLVASGIWEQIPSRDTQTLITGKIADGDRYNVRVRTINGVGAPSVWVTYYNHTVVGKTAIPPAPTEFLVDRQPDGTREFTANYNNKPKDFAGYRIYYKLGTGQALPNMELLNPDGLITAFPFESNQLAAGAYTFALTAVDTSGLESTGKYIETTLADPRLGDVIYTVYPASTGWPGTKTDCHVDNNSWLEADSTATWDTLPATWDEWTAWNYGAISPIVYEALTIDLGFVTTFTPLINMLGDGTPTIEIDWSNDGSSWNGWTLPQQVDARYLKVRISVAGTAPLIKHLAILLSGAAIVEEINDLDTSTLTGVNRIGVGDIRLPITKPFNTITQVQLALQSVGPGWSWSLDDKDAAVGPRIKIYNSNDVLADANIDANIRGL